jgi:hypothetical protein
MSKESKPKNNNLPIKFDKDHFFMVVLVLLILAFFKTNSNISELKGQIAALEGENAGLKQQMQQNLNEFRQAQIDRMDGAQKSREQIKLLKKQLKQVQEQARVKKKEQLKEDSIQQLNKNAQTSAEINQPVKSRYSASAKPKYKLKKTKKRSMIQSQSRLADQITKKLRKIQEMTTLE